MAQVAIVLFLWTVRDALQVISRPLARGPPDHHHSLRNLQLPSSLPATLLPQPDEHTAVLSLWLRGCLLAYSQGAQIKQDCSFLEKQVNYPVLVGASKITTTNLAVALVTLQFSRPLAAALPGFVRVS
jgi:hypothetical protein